MFTFSLFNLFLRLLAAAQLLPVALDAEDVVLERVALLAFHAAVQDKAAILGAEADLTLGTYYVLSLSLSVLKYTVSISPR